MQDARKIFAPPKDKILSSMEELIQNFMIVTEGPQIPEGEVYFGQKIQGSPWVYVVSKVGRPLPTKDQGTQFLQS